MCDLDSGIPRTGAEAAREYLFLLWVSLVGCLSGFGAQSGALESQNQATVERPFGEADLPELAGGERGAVPLFVLYLGVRLTAEEKSRETSVRVSERRLTEQRWPRFVKSNWRPFFCGFEWPFDPGRP